MSTSSAYLDLHLHVLPGLDDGARHMEATLDILRGLAEAGYGRVVSTPHADDRRHTYGPDRIAALCDEVRAAVAEAGLPIQVDFGAEYAYGPRFHAELVERRLTTLAGSRYVLLELPEEFLPATMASTLFEVGAAGYYPVLAHPERCRPFHDDVPRLEALAAGRALVQVSFRSLAGTFGRTVKRTAWTLVTEGVADLVATDCHSPRELGKVVRPVLAELQARVPATRLHKLLVGTPSRMLAA